MLELTTRARTRPYWCALELSAAIPSSSFPPKMAPLAEGAQPWEKPRTGRARPSADGDDDAAPRERAPPSSPRPGQPSSHLSVCPSELRRSILLSLRNSEDGLCAYLKLTGRGERIDGGPGPGSRPSSATIRVDTAPRVRQSHQVTKIIQRNTFKEYQRHQGGDPFPDTRRVVNSLETNRR